MYCKWPDKNYRTIFWIFALKTNWFLLTDTDMNTPLHTQRLSVLPFRLSEWKKTTRDATFSFWEGLPPSSNDGKKMDQI